MPETSETLMGSFTKFFGSMKQTFFDGKLWYSLLCIKFFDTAKFLKHWSDAHETFGHCDTNNFRRKNMIPLLCRKFFVTIFFLENRRGPSQNFSFRSCETKIFDRTVMLPRSYAWKILKWKVFWNKKLFSNEIFWHSETKIFWTENRDKSPSHPYIKETSDKILKLPPLLLEIFRFQNFSETQKCSLTKFIGTVTRDFFNGV